MCANYCNQRVCMCVSVCLSLCLSVCPLPCLKNHMLVPSQDELGDYGMKGIWHKNAEDDKGGSTGDSSELAFS